MEAVTLCAVTLMGPTHAPAPEDLCWVRTTIHAYVSQCSCWELCRVQGIGSVLPFFMCSASAPDSNCENGTHGCHSICDGDVCSCKNNTSYRLSRSRRHCIGMKLQSTNLALPVWFYFWGTIFCAVCVLTLDIDECLEDVDMCSHICNNTLGSYQCSCPKDLSLALDLHNCGKDACTNGRASSWFLPHGSYSVYYANDWWTVHCWRMTGQWSRLCSMWWMAR